jgi:hypothetical protein
VWTTEDARVVFGDGEVDRLEVLIYDGLLCWVWSRGLGLRLWLAVRV